MAAKYDVDDKVTIQGKVIEVVINEDAITYQVKIKSNNKSTTMYFEEDELSGGDSPTPPDDTTPSGDDTPAEPDSGETDDNNG